MTTRLLIDGPASGPAFALAHGAGAGMETPFLEQFSEGLARQGIRTVRFEFPYMAARREGKRGPPDREPTLRATWLEVIAQLGRDGFGLERLVIGGKSMGGRMASLVADESRVAGLVCLGYPFHPTGKPQQLRTAHLAELRTPTLIVQGQRDAFGTKAEVESYALSPAIRVLWSPDGDHSLKPRKSSGRTEEQNLEEGVAAVGEFIRSVTGK